MFQEHTADWQGAKIAYQVASAIVVAAVVVAAYVVITCKQFTSLSLPYLPKMWYVETFTVSGTARTAGLTKVVVAHIVIPHIVAALVPIAVIVAEGRPIDLVDRGCATGGVPHSLWKVYRHTSQLFIAASG